MGEQKNMYVHRVSAVNFRVFGDRSSSSHLALMLHEGLNVLVGENDAGKTSIVDVMRYVLLTTSNDFLRIEDDDYVQPRGEGGSRSGGADARPARLMRQVTTATPTQGREGIPRWNAGGMAQCGRPARGVQALAGRCHRQQPGDPGDCVRHSAVTTDCH